MLPAAHGAFAALFPATLTLAEENNASSIVVWSLALICALLVGFFLVSWVRKRLKAPEETPSTGFSLSDLREMHRKGQLSTEEFEKAKAAMTAAMQASLKRQEEERKQRAARQKGHDGFGVPPSEL